VQVRLGARAASIGPRTAAGFRVNLSRDAQAEADQPSEQSIGCDAVVLAVPADQAARLATTAGVTQAATWPGLGYSPILNAHVVYDRRVTDLPFAAGVDSPIQWVFDKTSQAGLPSGQYLAISISAADNVIDVPTAELRRLFVPALEQLFPAAAKASIRDFFVTRERRATFRQAPGTGVLRPGAATSVPGLALAGAWTSTGWPDTMEGAVRSGHAAAQQLIRELAALPSANRADELDNAWSGAS
jgi:predicted NAD/FAD-dependent oxidoreductase